MDAHLFPAERPVGRLRVVQVLVNRAVLRPAVVAQPDVIALPCQDKSRSDIWLVGNPLRRIKPQTVHHQYRRFGVYRLFVKRAWYPPKRYYKAVVSDNLVLLESEAVIVADFFHAHELLVAGLELSFLVEPVQCSFILRKVFS